MREVFTHQDYTRVGYFKSILDAEGVENFIRNQYTHSTMTELPSGVFFPSLCVLHDEDYERAMEILAPYHHPLQPTGEDWICPACGETVPTGFEICWKCEGEKPS